MGNKIFRYGYIFFVVSMLCFSVLSFFHVISFGVDEGNALTNVIILFIVALSLIIFLLVNSNKKENIYANILRGILLLLMVFILLFLLSDCMGWGWF